MNFLHNGTPKMNLQAEWNIHPNKNGAIISKKLLSHKRTVNDYGKLLEKILSRPNIASKEKWIRQYDHEVGARTIVKPFEGKELSGPMNAAVLKPLYHSDKALLIANGIAPRYSKWDTYLMTQCAMDEAVRNLVASGANINTIVGLDNFCWPNPIISSDNPDGKYKLAQLVRSWQSAARSSDCL